MASKEKRNTNELYSFLSCITFVVFFTHIADSYAIFADIHINLLCFSGTFFIFLFAGRYKEIEWSRNRAVKLILLFSFVGLLSVPFAVWPINALDMWKQFVLIRALICFFCLASIQNEKQLTRAVYAFLLGTFLLVSMLHINPMYTDTGRAFISYNYDPNDLAMIFAVTFPLVIGQLFVADNKGRVLFSLFMLLLISGILKTGSRGGLLGLAFALLLILFSSVVKVKIRYKALFIVVAVFFLFSSAAVPVLERWEDVISGRDYNVTDTEEGGGGRIGIWKAGLRLFSENFFLGVGVGNSSTAMGERFGQYGWITMHNTYLQGALEMGIGGIVLFLFMLGSIWRNCSQVIRGYTDQSLHNRMYILAYSLRISLLTLIVVSFLLSQVYSIIIPFFLIIADRVKFLAAESPSEHET